MPSSFQKNKPVQCDFFADEKSIVVTIIDRGIGILPDELSLVFDSFYRGKNVNGYQGTGIGLYVTSKIINLFNGTITVKSVPDHNTIVSIQFTR